MLYIAICDDMEDYGELLAEIVAKWALERQINVQMKRFVSGEELLADIEATGYFDIILLDIVLNGGMDGIATARKIKEIYQHVCLIFISQHDTYYKEVFQVHPFQYLEKTASVKWIMEVLDQAEGNYRYLNEIFTFRFKGTTYSIRLREVLYFASDKRIIQIWMENGKVYTYYEKLDELQNKLEKYNNRFLRIHQSYLVNGRQILQFHPKYVVMQNQNILPISTGNKNSIVQYHMELLHKNY